MPAGFPRGHPVILVFSPLSTPRGSPQYSLWYFPWYPPRGTPCDNRGLVTRGLVTVVFHYAPPPVISVVFLRGHPVKPISFPRCTPMVPPCIIRGISP